MARNNQAKNRKFRRDRRGVGAIMGGVLLTAILLTTMLLYFITILDNDQRRASYDIQSAQVNQDKSAEALEASRDQDLFTNDTGSYINAVLNNDGSLPLIVSYAALFCIDDDCPTPNNPIIAQADKTLNAKEVATRHVGPVSDDLSYRVDFITERGNIVSTEECVVDLSTGICTNDESETPDFIISADPKVLVMEAGKSAQSTITVTSVGGFSSDVTLSTPPLNGGKIIGTFNVNPVTPSGNSNLTISADSDATPGTYAMVVTGTDGSIEHQTTISLTILEEECVTCAVNEGIVQGTGSLQLDFRAFGSILPQLGTRDGIDQRGWQVATASNYGEATGYPAFEIPYRAHVFFVEKMRNLDPSGEDITLTRKTALITNQGTVPAGQQSVVYICKENTSASDGVEPYRESTANKLIPSTPITAAPTVGWQEVYFCTENPGSDYSEGNGSCGSSAASTGYCPEHTNEQLNGIIMVARGVFTPSLSQYGQTIPYQSSQPGTTPYSTFYWCLYNSNTNEANTCPAPNSDSNPTQDATLIYSGTRSAMQSGITIYAHYGDTSGSIPNPPADITWIYPDGTSVVLADDQNLVGQNIEIDLPTTNSDGVTPIDCEPGESEEFYIIKINDSYSSDGTRNVYYMTFRMTCT